MTNKPSKYYTLPASTYYPEYYEAIVINFDHVISVRRDGDSLLINGVVGHSHVTYTDAFEVDLLVRDIINKMEEYKQLS